MAGRFPLYTDADVRGRIVDALQYVGWDLVRAIDLYPEKTKDPVHFTRAAELNRVLVTNDNDHRKIAVQWMMEGRPFRGVIWWPQQQSTRMSPGDFLRRFEEYAAQDDPFAAYKILILNPYR